MDIYKQRKTLKEKNYNEYYLSRIKVMLLDYVNKEGKTH